MQNTQNQLATEIVALLVSKMEAEDNIVAKLSINGKMTINEVKAQIRKMLVAKISDIIEQSALAIVGFVATAADGMPTEHFAQFADEFRDRMIDIHRELTEMPRSDEDEGKE